MPLRKVVMRRTSFAQPIKASTSRIGTATQKPGLAGAFMDLRSLSPAYDSPSLISRETGKCRFGFRAEFTCTICVVKQEYLCLKA